VYRDLSFEPLWLLWDFLEIIIIIIMSFPRFIHNKKATKTFKSALFGRRQRISRLLPGFICGNGISKGKVILKLTPYVYFKGWGAWDWASGAGPGEGGPGV
jgi:hypothetical protein